MAFSPDGEILAAGDDSSNLARLWNTVTGQQIGPALNTGPAPRARKLTGRELASRRTCPLHANSKNRCPKVPTLT